MKKWMKQMAIIGAVLFVGGIGVTSIGAAIGGAAAGLDFLIDQEKAFQDKYDWGDSEEIQDDTEQLPEETDEQDEMEGQLDENSLDEDDAALIPGEEGTVEPDEDNAVQPEENNTVEPDEYNTVQPDDNNTVQPFGGQPEGDGTAAPEQGGVNLPGADGQLPGDAGIESLEVLPMGNVTFV